MSHAPDDSKISTALLGRFLTEECSTDEERRVRAWMTRTPLAAEVVTLLARYRANRVVPEQVVDTAALWRRIQERITPEQTARRKIRSPGVGRQPWRQGVWYAAVVVVIGVLGVVIGWNGRGRHVGRSLSAVGSTYTTTNGERANITLPDGSTVALDVASRLDVPADYAAGHRTVRLVGAALFTVTHHDGAPFTVDAGATSARVLGTSFVVRHYRTDTTTTVAVRDGRVAVGPMIVTAARMVEVGPSGVAHNGAADASMFSFASGVLTLSSQPLSRAIPELDRWYAADIRLGDSSFGRVPVKGRFVAGSLSDLASILELMLDARVVRDGQVLTLYPRAR